MINNYAENLTDDFFFPSTDEGEACAGSEVCEEVEIARECGLYITLEMKSSSVNTLSLWLDSRWSRMAARDMLGWLQNEHIYVPTPGDDVLGSVITESH